MARRIAIIQGHPDAQARHFGHALADEYVKGCEDGSHEVKRIEVAKLDFPLLRTKEEFEKGMTPDSIKQAQDTIKWADHLVIIYPLWLGSMPALLQAFFEQLFRPGFAYEYDKSGGFPKKLLSGKSARIVVTMGMPAFAYRLPLVLSRPRPEESGAQHSWLLRHRPDQVDLDWLGGSDG
jgi:putative NADPH-quinone reductase